jgi:hypothetical protein
MQDLTWDLSQWTKQNPKRLANRVETFDERVGSLGLLFRALMNRGAVLT